MKRIRITAILLSTLLLLSTLASASGTPVSHVKTYTKKLTVNKSVKTVNVVEVDLKDKAIKVEAAVANDQIKTVEDLQSLVKRKNAIAAINANFFAAYSDFSPVGAFAHEGTYLWHTRYGTSVGISPDNEVIFQTHDLRGKAKVTLNGVEQSDYVWYLNRDDFKRSTIIFNNPQYPVMKLGKGIVVIAKDNTISEIKYAPAETAIPANGFLLWFNMDITPALKSLVGTKYTVGQQISYERIQENSDYIDESKYGEIITAGPRLLVDGKVDMDPFAEGFIEKKIVENKGQRSALGLTKDNRLLLVTVSKVTVYELADIMKQLGAYQATNLDGGASSGLYANGKIITTPGRKLSLFLTVKLK